MCDDMICGDMWWYYTRPKTPPFEDVFPIRNGDFPFWRDQTWCKCMLILRNIPLCPYIDPSTWRIIPVRCITMVTFRPPIRVVGCFDKNKNTRHDFPKRTPWHAGNLHQKQFFNPMELLRSIWRTFLLRLASLPECWVLDVRRFRRKVDDANKVPIFCGNLTRQLGNWTIQKFDGKILRIKKSTCVAVWVSVI